MVINCLLLFILSFINCFLVSTSTGYSQCGTETVITTQYCPGQYAEFDINNTDPKVKYHWTNTASSSDYGFTNHFISPSTIPTGSGAISYKYVKEITDTTGPRSKTVNFNNGGGSAINVGVPSNLYGASFDAQSNIVVNSIVIPVGTGYAPPGSTYSVQVIITSAANVVQKSIAYTFSYASLPKAGTSNFYLLSIPVNLSVLQGTGYTLEVSQLTDGNSLFVWFNPGSLGYPFTLNNTPNQITVKEKNYNIYSSNKIAAIMDWSITTLCPSKTVASNEQTNAALCCTPVVSPATITTSTGTNIVISPFSMTLTANGLPSTHYYEWYKNGVLVSGSGGVGKTTLNINSLGNYTVRAVINQSDVTKYSCYKETAISIQERVLYAQASKVNACIGETITLTAKGATGNVTWSPATNLNVTNAAKVIATPTAVGSLTYNVTAEVPLGNSVINGDFENGNTGFSSNLTYVAPTVNLNQNQYSVRKSVNPQGGLWKECPDHTTGSGNLFYTDGPTSIGASVWKQTISVQPNTNYTFSAWVTNTYASSDPSDPSYTVNATNARFQLQANGQALLATPFAISGKTCKWENVKSVWNSGNNTSITIAVLDMNSDGYGNDFALDDITFGAPGTQTDKVTLNVTDCFFVNAAALTTCKGDSVQIEAETNGLFAGWQLQGGGTTGIKTPNNPITWVKPGAANQTYVASATFQLGNLLTNGDFEEGDGVGFTSDYTCCLGTGIGHYSIDTDPQVAAVGASWAVKKKDHTSGEGLMYMSDGGNDPTKAVYKTTVDVVAGKQYAFSAWLANIHNEFLKPIPDTNFNAKTTNLGFVVNGQNLGNIKLPLDTAWHQFYSTWTSNITGTITIAIQDKETSSTGNDFVLDDIVFAPLYPTIKTATVNAGPCTVCNLPSTVNLVNTKISECEGKAVTLTGTFNNGGKTASNGGMYYAWYKQGASLTSASYSLITPNPTGTGSVNVPNKPFTSLLKSTDEGKWVLRVQDGNNPSNTGCFKEDTVTINITPLPLAPTGTNPPDFCENTTVPVWTAAAATNNTLQWYTVATLGIASATAPVITNTPSGVRTAWVSQKTSTATGGCEGPRLALTTNVIPLPVAPTGTDPADFCENGTPSVWAATALSGNSLQWYTAATNGTLSTTIPTITNTPSGIRNIWVSQKTAAGCEGPRLSLKTNVIAAPAPPVAGTNSNFCEGATAPTWNATALSGSSLLWYTAATGGVGNATNPTITNTAGVKNIWVSQKLTSAAGCESTRTPLTLTATPRTVITKQPKDTTLCEGTALSLVASGTGTGAISYVWKKGTATVGTNNRILSIATAAATDAGAYTVDVTSTCGTVTSNTVNVTINTKPVITTQPTDKGGCVGSSNSLSVVATGTPAPTFAWTPIGSGTGGTTSTLSFASLKATDAGNYTVEVKNSCATVTSNIAKVAITLNETPAVTLATSIAQACGDGTKTVVLTAGASGGGSAPTFTFKENGTAISPVAQTANTFTYTIPANATTAVQTLKFTVDMVSNTACLAPAPASFNVSGTATDFKVDPQVTATIANINETKLTICEQTRNLTAATLPASFTHTWTTVGGGANVSATGALTNIAFGGSTKTTYKVESPLKLCPSAEDTVTTVTAGKLTNPDAVVALNNDKICETASAPLLKGLTGLLPGEAGTWSVPAGATNTVTPAGQTGALQVGLNRFIYTIKSSTAVAPCDIDTALVTINIEKQPDAADAGADKKTCASTYTLGATAVTNGIGTWTPASAFTGDRTLFNAVATLVDNQANEFTWTVSNGVGAKCADKTDKVIITQAGKITSASPVASQSKPICSTDAAPLLNTTGVAVLKSEESAAWVAKAPATINTSTGQTAGLVVGDNTFQYIITTTVPGCDPDTGTVVIKAIAPPVASITAPILLSNTDLPSSHTFNTSPLPIAANQPSVGYKGEWAVAKITPTSVPTLGSPNTTIVNSILGMNFDESAKLTLTVSEETGTCTSPAVVTVTIERKNITEAKAKNDTICFGSGSGINYSQMPDAANLPNTSAGEKGEWISLGSSPTPTPNNSSLNVNFTSPGDYEYTYRIFNPSILDAGGNPIESKNNFIIRVDEMPTTSNAGISENVCTLPYPLAANAVNVSKGESGLWTGAGVTFTDATSNTSKTDGMTDGNTYILTWSIFSKYKRCAASTSTVTLKKLKNITTAKISTIKTDYCEETSFSLASNVADGTNNEIGEWTSTDLTIPSADKNNTTLLLSNLIKGTYIVTWKISSSSCPGGSSDAITLNIDKKPVVGTITSTRLCEESNVAFTATGFTSTTTPTYVWSAVAAPSVTSGIQSISSSADKAIYAVKSIATTGVTDQITVKVEATNGCGTTTVDTVYTFDLRPRGFAISFTSPTLKICASDAGPVVYNVTVNPVLPAQTDLNWYWNGVKKATTGLSYSLNSADYMSKTGNINLEVKAYNQCGEAIASDNSSKLISVEINQSKKLEVRIRPAITDSVCVDDLTLNKNQYLATAVTNGNALSGSETYTFTVTNFSGIEYKTSTNATGIYDATMLNDGDIVGVVISDQNGCFDAPRISAKATSVVNGFNYPNSTIISQNDTVCESKNSIKLEVNRTKNRKGNYNDAGIKWYKDGVVYDSSKYTIFLKTPTQTGTYTVVMKGSVCPDSTTKIGIKAKIYELPAFEFTENPLKIVYQEGITVPMPIVLSKPEQDVITETVWNSDRWLKFPVDTVHAVIVPVREETEINYNLSVSTGPKALGCTTDRSLVVINSLPLQIPNAFSPNGDGINDTWVIIGLFKYASVTVNVFNRWGNRVFQSTGSYTPWDGTVNGIPVSTGTYYAIVELKGSPDNSDDNVTKALTIVR